ncbi:MAG TPA: hypothetical protein VMN38_04980 [Sphingomicrobium sp.]|nr:hypothetical protein [Sphingomicrobium sp.]
MHTLFFVSALIILMPVAQQSEQLAAAREQQWLYRDTLGSGQLEPTAVFLSWDYSAVVFSATCDRRTRELVLRSALETGPGAPAVKPLEIGFGESTVLLRTIVSDGFLEGRTQVTEELATILRSDSDLEVTIPNEMGEPFYVGRGEPLRRLGLACGN